MAGQVPYTGIPQDVPAEIPRWYEEAPGASPAAFGGLVGQALKQGGQQIEQGANAAMAAAIRQQQLKNNLDANNAMNDFQEKSTSLLFGDPNNPNDPGYYGLKGQAAVDAYPATVKQLQELRDQISQGMGNPRARLDFDNFSRRLASQTLMDVGRHHFQQLDTATIASNKASEEIQFQQASLYYNDNRRFMDALGDALHAADQNAAVTHAAPEVLQADHNRIVDRFAMGRALRWGASDPGAAYNWVQQNAQMFTPDHYETLINHFKPQIDKDFADQYFNGLMAASGGAALNPVPKHGPAITPEGVRASGLPSAPAGRPDLQPGQQVAQPADADAWWAAAKNQESGGQQLGPDGKPLTSPKGAIGISQLMPETAASEAEKMGISFDLEQLKTDDKYNEKIGRHLMDRLVEKYGGDHTLALAAYNAGEGRADEWLRQNGDPRTGQISDADWAAKIPIAETRNYVQSIASRVGGTASPAAAVAASTDGNYPGKGIDFDAMDQHVWNDPGLTMDQRIAISGKLRSLQSALGDQYRNERRGLAQTISNAVFSLSKGQDVPVPDPAHIIQVFGQEYGDKLNDTLEMAKAEGASLNFMKGATREQIDAHDADLQKAWEDDPDHSRQLFHNWEAYRRARIELEKQLDTNPGLAVMDRPAVHAAKLALDATGQNDPNLPKLWQNLADASLNAQAVLGVAPAKQHLLPEDMAQSLAASIMKPGVDIKQQLDALQKRYGQTYPQVYRDLITLGKLSPAASFIGALPSGSPAAAMLSTWIRQNGTNPDINKLLGFTSAVGNAPTWEHQIQKDVGNNPEWIAFKSSLYEQGMSPEQIADMEGGIDQLGYAYRAATGAADPGPKAVADFLSMYDRIPNPGGQNPLPVPAGRGDIVSHNMAVTVNRLRFEDVQPPKFLMGQTPEQWFHHLQILPFWVRTASGDGAVLRDSHNQNVLDRNGQPIAVMFSEPQISDWYTSAGITQANRAMNR